MHECRSCQETGPLESSSVSQVFRFKIVGLLEIVEGLLVILPRLGILAFFVEPVGRVDTFGKNRKLQTEQQQNDQSRTDQPSHQAVLIKSLSPATTQPAVTHPARTRPVLRKSQPAECPSGRRVQKVPEIRIIASHQPASEVIGASVFTLIGTCTPRQFPVPSSQKAAALSQSENWELRTAFVVLSFQRRFSHGQADYPSDPAQSGEKSSPPAHRLRRERRLRKQERESQLFLARKIRGRSRSHRNRSKVSPNRQDQSQGRLRSNQGRRTLAPQLPYQPLRPRQLRQPCRTPHPQAPDSQRRNSQARREDPAKGTYSDSHPNVFQEWQNQSRARPRERQTALGQARDRTPPHRRQGSPRGHLPVQKTKLELVWGRAPRPSKPSPAR